MGQLSPKLRSGAGGLITYWCQGCEEPHQITVNHGRWTWDGNVEAPTFSPSVLVTSGHYMSGHTGRCWCDHIREHPEDEDGFTCGRCHTFIRGGMVEFLGDCTHALAGQTLPLPDLPEHMRDG